MRSPIPWDIYGDRKVSLNEDIPIVGRDFTGATFAAQVRNTPDAASMLIALTVTLTYGGTDTIANHIAAGRLGANIKNYVNAATGVRYVDSDSVPLSIIHVHADNSLMVSPTVPAAAETGDAVTLAWDMLITPSGGTADKWVAGAFIVRGTVTQ